MAMEDGPEMDAMEMLERARQEVQLEIRALVVKITAGYVNLVEEIEIGCEPEDRRGAEIAKRQIADEIKKASLFFRERFGG